MSRRAHAAAVVATITWGVLTFGAVYPWTYWPLLVVCSIAGLWTATEYGVHGITRNSLFRPWLIFSALVVLQVTPLPRVVVDAVSPQTARLRASLDLSEAAVAFDAPDAEPLRIADARWTTLSSDPAATMRGLAFVTAFAVLLFGLSRAAASVPTAWIAGSVVWLGAVVALLALLQRAGLFGAPGLIYGFWKPYYGTEPYGPFVNRNHFAGWMLLAIPVSIGYLMTRIDRDVPPDARSVHALAAWANSAGAMRIILTAFAIAVMGTSLLLSASRSGALCLAAAALCTSGFIMTTRRSWLLRAGAVALVAVLVAVTFASTDTSDLERRFGKSRSELAMRVAVWRDTLGIIRDFPVAGTGFNTYDRAMLVYQTSPRPPRFEEAHNDYLQLLSEGGVMLAIAAGAAIFIFVRDVAKRLRAHDSRYWLRAGAAAGMIAIALQSLVDFSLQIPGVAVLAVVLAALMLQDTRSRAGDRPRRAREAVRSHHTAVAATPAVAATLPEL